MTRAAVWDFGHQRLRRAWAALRRFSGDDAYERYLAHCRTHLHDAMPISAGEFYRRELERKWSGVNRCC
jgi:uncharacterized short protein YbdD (DUF466 family)